MTTESLYITGAGVSSESGIPTFRGADGFWSIGSENYTPQEMATRIMFENNPAEFYSGIIKDLPFIETLCQIVFIGG